VPVLVTTNTLESVIMLKRPVSMLKIGSDLCVRFDVVVRIEYSVITEPSFNIGKLLTNIPDQPNTHKSGGYKFS